MARFRVPTSTGTYVVETDVADPTDAELLDLIERQTATGPLPVGPKAVDEAEEPGLGRRALALGARVGLPIVGAVAGAP
ncbi:MAG: hypothetical protein L0206_20140, partial [Actinobacteria bacterium]|nr:hypothetical protein [Actinomycetota bacterium]